MNRQNRRLRVWRQSAPNAYDFSRQPLRTLCLFWILGIPILLKAQECQITLSATTRPATCQANGEIHCALSDTSGGQLEQIRYSYLPETGPDSIQNTEMSSVTQLRPGYYTVIVAALCRTGLLQADLYRIVSDTLNRVLVEQAYTPPVSGIPYNIYARHAPYGIVPSFACADNGKIQIRMEHGSFPYHFDVWRINGGDTVFLRTTTFSAPQGSGSTPLAHDYAHYYTLDSLGVGRYRIICHDGCGYHTPPLEAEVPRVRHALRTEQHLLRNSSGDTRTHNVLAFKEYLASTISGSSNDDYYWDSEHHHLHYEYRFVNPTTIAENGDTTDWRAFPAPEGDGILFYDTLRALEGYAEVWFRTVTLQIRPVPCADTLFSYNYTIYPQYPTFISTNTTPTGSVGKAFTYYDQCGRHYHKDAYSEKLNLIIFYHTDYGCTNPENIGCENQTGYSYPGSITNSIKGMMMHDYITFPLRAKIVNISADTVYTSYNIPSAQYNWQWIWDAIPELDQDTLSIEIYDAYGAPIYAQCSKYIYDYGEQAEINNHYPYQWKTHQDAEHRHCPGAEHTITLYQYNGQLVPYGFVDGSAVSTYSGDTIRIIESPGGNAYNFEAYSDTARHWAYSKRHPEQAFEVHYEAFLFTSNVSYPSLRLTAPGLPNGRYVWEVSSACEGRRDTIVQEIDYTQAPDFAEPLTYRFEPQCTRLNIVPTSGRFAVGGAPTETYFSIRAEGLVEHSVNSVQIGDTLSAGVYRSYMLSAYTLPEGNPEWLSINPCYVHDSVIVWDGNPFALDYELGYVCNAADSSGFVVIRGKRGQQPYHYTLFDRSDGAGNILAENGSGDFQHVACHFRQDMSVALRDACGAHFITNFQITNMEQIRKGWIENNQSNLTMRLGDTCHLHSISLGDVGYHWTGPGGFERFRQEEVFPILSESQQGTYRIAITGSGCGVLTDSIHILVDANPCPDAVDYDGYRYPAVRIDQLCWTRVNLQSQHYADGRSIPNAQGYSALLFPDTVENIRVFGRLYTWQGVSDGQSSLDAIDSAGHIQGVCPAGWYLPDVTQYERLRQHGTAALRAPEHWIDGLGGDNSTRFSALPAGLFNGISQRYENLLGEAWFWAYHPHNPSENETGYCLKFVCGELRSHRQDLGNRYSVRCILAE